jgi:mRNA interferase MazF
LPADNEAAWRSRIIIDCTGKPTEIAVDHIRTISKLRLKQAIDRLNQTEAEQLRQLIGKMYGVALEKRKAKGKFQTGPVP